MLLSIFYVCVTTLKDFFFAFLKSILIVNNIWFLLRIYHNIYKIFKYKGVCLLKIFDFFFQIFRLDQRSRLSGRGSLLGRFARHFGSGQSEIRSRDQVPQDSQEGQIGKPEERNSQLFFVFSFQHERFHQVQKHKWVGWLLQYLLYYYLCTDLFCCDLFWNLN